jgi:16S rRNA (guanine1207-N2)-methyltransferase
MTSSDAGTEAARLEPYVKKVVDLRAGHRHFQLGVAQELFSSHDVDKGTRLLLRSLMEGTKGAGLGVLDLGCGYGPIAIALRACGLAGSAHLVDRDALALAFATENVQRNQLGSARVSGSLIYDDLGAERFDLVVSNVPGKGPPALYRRWLLGARPYLRPGGEVAIVVVRPLAATVEVILESTPDISVRRREEHPSHSVYHYGFAAAMGAGVGMEGADLATAEDAGAIEVLRRSTFAVRTAGPQYELQTVHGLAEFDSLTFSTSLLIEALQARRGGVNHLLCFNPGQGHLPVAVWSAFTPQATLLVDRDLLALRTSRDNLWRGGCPSDGVALVHGLGLGHRIDVDVDGDGGDGVGVGGYDLVIDNLRAKEPPAATSARLAEVLPRMAAGGWLLVGGTSTSVTRAAGNLERERTVRLVERHRSGGFSAALFVRR